jgi:hypothetical protein
VKVRCGQWVNEALAFQADFFDLLTNKRKVVQGYGTRGNEYRIPNVEIEEIHWVMLGYLNIP